MEDTIYDVLILGGGPAALTAAIYTSRAALKTLVVAGELPGGQLMDTTDVENFPGFPRGILGPNLMSEFRAQAERFGTSFIDENVIKISGSREEGFKAETSCQNIIYGRSVIVATGASAKWLGLEGEQRLRGKGVSACAHCDGFFFKDMVVAVVGGGDAAMEEALYMTRFASKIYLLIRSSKDGMRASKIMQERVFGSDKLTPYFDVEVKEVMGDGAVSGLRIFNNRTREEKVLDDVRGLFVAIGHKPNTDFLKGFVDLDKMGYVVLKGGTHSSKEGVFVAGDAADYRYRQAVTAAGFGCMAALDVEKSLSNLH